MSKTTNKKSVTKDEIGAIAHRIKRDKGVSWTKMPQAIFEELGITMKAHEIRDRVRSYEASNGITNKQSRSLAVMLSDVHVGKKTSSFNFIKMKERMVYLMDQVVDEFKQQKRRYNVEEIHFCFIGDIIDNDSLYPTQPHHVDHENAGHATEQIKLASQFFSEEIDRVQKATKAKVVIHAVKGNHGRISKFTNEANNYDIMFYNNLETMVSRNKNISTNMSHDFYCMASIQGHNFLLHHGHGIRMYQNIPWYGLVQRVMRWAGSLPFNFDYVVVGHFHTCGEQHWNDKTIFMNGTAVTDDTFGLEVLGLGASNNFWLFGVNKDQGICYQQKINLSEV